ncbi:MAG: anthranilate phosphoribosyltransferase [Akkermansiaceae bacterium]|nr:anthranilate phosphoribosyltransferase [Akkermansiaceae bacterium]NNM29195.1 anthranilate phosphoribosyltransferase [Akkermansiaceae bacterium]
MDALLNHLAAKQPLDDRQVAAAVEFLLDEDAEVDKKAGFLKSLADKGETASEIAAFVECLLERAVDPELGKLAIEVPVIDVCGTGGDKLNLFNVSTTSMFVIAAGGAMVAKHGNRGITSKSGGADVLEALGIRIDLPPAGFRRCMSEAGIGFLFAPAYHPAFKAVVPVRKLLAEQGIRTIFNLIGPLLNPARPTCQLVGVMQRDLAPVFAEILQRLGRESAWAVHGTTGDGRSVDEVSLMGSTRVCKAGTYEELLDEEIRPRDFGLQHAEVDDLRGGDAAENAAILKSILEGAEHGPKRDMVLMNAGAGLACAGLADTVGDGIEQSRRLIDSGAAFERLKALQDAAQ